MKNNRVFIAIIELIIFIIFFVVVLSFISYMSKPLDISLENMAGIYGEKKNSLDVIYLGGSSCYMYYNPMQAWEKYGIVSYDYAAEKMQPEFYKYMIIEMLKKQSPQLIIVDVRPFQYRQDPFNLKMAPSGNIYRNILKGMRFSYNKINFVFDNVGTNLMGVDKLSCCFDIVRFHKVSFHKENFFMMIENYQTPYNGFSFSVEQESFTKEDISTDEQRELLKQTNEILIDFLEYIKQTNIDYLFVVSPYVEDLFQKKNLNYIEKMITNYGYQYMDFNEYTSDMNLNYATDFSDGEHVNFWGAKKYTDFLSNYIVENYNIKNRKNDEKYSYMNYKLMLWKDERAKKGEENEIEF